MAPLPGVISQLPGGKLFTLDRSLPRKGEPTSVVCGVEKVVIKNSDLKEHEGTWWTLEPKCKLPKFSLILPSPQFGFISFHNVEVTCNYASELTDFINPNST